MATELALRRNESILHERVGPVPHYCNIQACRIERSDALESLRTLEAAKANIQQVKEDVKTNYAYCLREG